MNITVVALMAALLGPLVTYLAAVRRLSGKIGTSAAEDLWQESRSIREDLTTRNEFLNDKIRALEARVDDLAKQNMELYLENGNLKRMVEGHERTIRTLRDEVEDLRSRNHNLEGENRRLKGRVRELETINERSTAG